MAAPSRRDVGLVTDHSPWFHLVVEPSDRGFKLTDQSANGTLMGNQRVKRSKVDTPPDIPLRIGPYLVRLKRLDQGGPGLSGWENLRQASWAACISTTCGCLAWLSSAAWSRYISTR